MIVFYFIVYLFTSSFVHSLNKTCFDHICYEFNESTANYSVASDSCRQRNLTLAFVYNQTVQSILSNAINSSSISYYIGLKYIRDQRFIWDCKSDKIPDLNWDTINMKNSDLENCVYLQNNVTNIGPCQTNRGYICSNTSHHESDVDPTSQSTGSCPPDFFRFLDKCYSMNRKCIDESRNWTTAQQHCQSLASGSHLVIIDSMIEQEFVTALVTQSPHALWTGLVHAKVAEVFPIWIDARSNTSIPQRRLPKYNINFKINEPNNVEEERCLMVYHRLSDVGRINDEKCSVTMNHLCEASLIQNRANSPEQRSPLFYQGKCMENFFEFNETCFKVDKLAVSHNQTNTFCNEKMLFVHGYIDVAFIRALMAYKDISDGWISVFDKTEVDNAVPNSGARYLLEENGNETMKLDRHSCYYFSSRHKGLHRAERCNDTHASICYYFLDNHEQSTNDLKCPLNWIKVGTKCFQTKMQNYNFKRSKFQCQIYNGKLATLKSMKEVQAVSALSQIDSWIGLTGESYLNNSWVDGSPMDYCLFRHDKDQKDIIKADPKSYCFILRHLKSEWVARRCSDPNVFTCEQRAEKNRCPPNLPFNIDGDCYGTFDTPQTWEDAEKYCSKLLSPNSHLVSFHSMSQEMTLLEQINSTQYYWIGMKFYDGTGRWVDGTQLNYKRNYLRFSSDFTYGRSCVTTAKPLDQGNYWWKNENCALKKPFICKMSRKKYIPLGQKKRISPNYYCPTGFTKHNLHCYKFFNESLTWTDADNTCRTIFKYSLPTARLARFDSLRQFESVLSSLREFNNVFFWIGLYEEKETKELVWVDEKPLEIVKYVRKSNDSWNMGNKVAVEISRNPFRNGHWYKQEGAQHLPFLCRVDPHERFHGFSDSRFVESYNNITDGGCPTSFVAYNGYCYHYNKKKLKFDDARTACGRIGASLLVVKDTFEENFIKSIMRDNSEIFIWMGFRIYANNAMTNWETIDNLPVYYTHWNQLESYSHADESLQNKIVGCYGLQLRDESNVINGMTQFSCSVSTPSICKMPMDPSVKESQPVKCAKSQNGTSYLLNVTHSKTGSQCVRWDLVYRKDAYLYHRNTMLVSSLPFNANGYLSYSLQRCSEIIDISNPTTMRGYSCYTISDNKFYLEDCEMTPCHARVGQQQERRVSGHPFLVMISVVFIIFGIAFLIFAFRSRWLANYRVREFLARVLGRYQPDWLRYPTQSRSQPGGGTSSVGGTGFVNPVYTPLESRY